MTTDELRQVEFESFISDLKELIAKHKESLLALKMGIHFEHYRISCTHYNDGRYVITTNGAIGITPVFEWHD